MNQLGFPNTDIYSEHEQGGAESFWPSFTDIMMVIVMVFLMITVAVILNNWQLIDSLKASVEAERQAMAKAQSALNVVEVKAKENETLEQRLNRLESLLTTRTQELQQTHQLLDTSQQSLDHQKKQAVLLYKQNAEILKLLQSSQKEVVATQASIESLQQKHTQGTELLMTAQQLLEQQKQKVDELEKEKDVRVATTQQTQKTLDSVSEELKTASKELALLKQKDIEGNKKLISLQGEHETLNKKYQKLLRPARSIKGKHVVRVIFNRSNSGVYSYQLGDKNQTLISLNRKDLEIKLDKLKKKYADSLYVKIIIPASSQVSHAEAWKFTNDMLSQYDYYRSGER